jgi:hypothetical protein
MGEARLGNVAGALLLGEPSQSVGSGGEGSNDLEHAARLLADVFEEAWLIGGVPSASLPGRRVAEPPGPPGALRGLAGALAAATAERVLVVSAEGSGPTLDLVLALTAWPEQEAVVVEDPKGAPVGCAIYRRESVLRSVHEKRAGPEASLDELHAALGAERVSTRVLGLAEGGPSVSTGGLPEPRGA